MLNYFIFNLYVFNIFSAVKDIIMESVCCLKVFKCAPWMKTFLLCIFSVATVAATIQGAQINNPKGGQYFSKISCFYHQGDRNCLLQIVDDQAFYVIKVNFLVIKVCFWSSLGGQLLYRKVHSIRPPPFYFDTLEKFSKNKTLILV